MIEQDDPWEGSGIGFSPDGLMASLPPCPFPDNPEEFGKVYMRLNIVDEAPDISDELWSELGKAFGERLNNEIAKVLLGGKSDD